MTSHPLGVESERIREDMFQMTILLAAQRAGSLGEADRRRLRALASGTEVPGC